MEDSDIGWKYQLTNTVVEDPRWPNWCICFNTVDANHRSMFATCGGTTATVYEALPGGEIDVVQVYEDDGDEEYFACKFGLEEKSGAPYLLLAGRTGVLKVINCVTGKLHWGAIGHGDAINDITVHAWKPSIVITASRDQSLRLWNTQSKVCLLVLGGVDGHRNEVLSVDFHPFQGNMLASCGMDNMVKIWDLSSWEKEMRASYDHDSDDLDQVWNTGRHSVVEFSTDQAHTNYVDCVRWLHGDLVLTKSVTNKIALWRPHRRSRDASSEKGLIELITLYDLEDCGVWFIRFSLDASLRRLACGTNGGSVLLFDLKKPGEPMAVVQRRGAHPQAKKFTVRQTALSFDGRTLLGCCDDGTIWRWDVDGEKLPYYAEKVPTNTVARGRGGHSKSKRF